MKIAVIGSCMVDLIAYTDTVPKAGETLVAKEFAMGCGGKGANQAVAASKLGAEVLMMGRVGDDAFADNTLANFEKYGVSTEHVSKVPGVSSGVAPIWVDADSQNRILIIPGANMHLLPADITAAKDQLKQCSMIILQLEIPLETVYAAIEFGNANGIPVLLNPAPASTELNIDYACRCDYFVPNETELEILTGMPVDTEDQIAQAAGSLLAKGLKNLIVTLGDKGALWMHGGERRHITAPSVGAVDTTGAGDAFIGCFAAELAAGTEVEAAIGRAVSYASHSVTGKGTQTSYATADEFSQWQTAAG
ncbi:ribokinase [Congregibacter litoralis]|uniref:Deoxyribokinase n=1 Tax=Congregibacter litoralis KT71 TaxID=314285 RepID=A4A8W2_9GAMM|nr:ribokinase [Congregibacter litoralis]EAQ97504.1 ribokinase [Congregibacter litoralis KT71]